MNVLVFLSCQSDLTSGVFTHMAAAWDLGTNLLIFRCSFIFAIPIWTPAVSCEVSKHNKEDLSARHDKERMQRRRSSTKASQT